MADNYMQPVNNHFAFEDVDDNVFLSRRRTNNGNLDHANSSVDKSIDRSPSFEDKRLLSYQEKRREIENRSLESTQRSLGLLYDTEQIGNDTAVELARQRDQLERTDKNLDDINATLRYSQRHLNSIKSVFGSIKNHLFGTRETNVATNNERKLSTNVNAPQVVTEKAKPVSSSSNDYDQHPISRLRDDISHTKQTTSNRQERPSNPFEVQLEANLNEMSENLSRLKGLATDLGSEIEYQNELLDNMTYKVEDVDMKLSRQNKDISKLLGKK